MPTSIRLAQDLENRYARLAESTGRSRSYYYKEALADAIDNLERKYGLLQLAEEYRGSEYGAGEYGSDEHTGNTQNGRSYDSRGSYSVDDTQAQVETHLLNQAHDISAKLDFVTRSAAQKADAGSKKKKKKKK